MFKIGTRGSMLATTQSGHVRDWLAEAGYDRPSIERIAQLSGSDRVREAIDAGMRVVDDEIRTVTIPSLIAGGKLHKGAIDVADLEGMR